MTELILNRIFDACEGDRKLHIHELEKALRRALSVLVQRAEQPEGGSERALISELVKEHEHD